MVFKTACISLHKIRLCALMLVMGCGRSVDAPQPVVSQVVISASSQDVRAGDSLRLTATATSSSGETISNRPVTWTSMDTSRATISASGVVTGKSEGSVTVTAGVDAIVASTQLKILPTLGVSPNIAPTGRLLFRRDSRVASSRTDGTDIRYLTPATMSVYPFVVSPDGQWIGFITGLATSREAYVMKSDGSGMKKIGGPADYYPPAWLPGGKGIVLQESVNGAALFTALTVDGVTFASFYIDDALKVPRATTSVLLRGTFPSGDRILLWRLGSDDALSASLDGKSAVSIGPGQRARFSPDGSRIASDCSGVCTMNADGSDRRKLPSPAGLDPWFSPDNRYIAYGCGGLCIIRADNGQVVANIQEPRVGSGQIAWAPDGNSLFYRCDYVTGGGNFVSIRSDVCRVSVDGTGFVNLFADSNVDVLPYISATVGHSRY